MRIQLNYNHILVLNENLYFHFDLFQSLSNKDFFLFCISFTMFLLRMRKIRFVSSFMMTMKKKKKCNKWINKNNDEERERINFFRLLWENFRFGSLSFECEIRAKSNFLCRYFLPLSKYFFSFSLVLLLLLLPVLCFAAHSFCFPFLYSFN